MPSLTPYLRTKRLKRFFDIHGNGIRKRLMLALLLLFSSGSITPLNADTTTFAAGELLGKPTDTSITINIVPDTTIEYYYEFGTTQGGPYPLDISPETAIGGQPHEVVVTGLDPNTRYYYRMVYDADGDVGDGDFEVRA